jgi:putative FmdB family regulatory protein
MPVYEYECTACGHQFEEFQKITDKPIRTCPACHRRKVRKLISQSTFVLKGSGWYVTDYCRKDGNGKDGAKRDASDEKGGDAGAKDAKKGSKKGSGKSSSTQPTP